MKDFFKFFSASEGGLCMNFFANKDCELEMTEAVLWRTLLSQLSESSTCAKGFILPKFRMASPSG